MRLPVAPRRRRRSGLPWLALAAALLVAACGAPSSSPAATAAGTAPAAPGGSSSPAPSGAALPPGAFTVTLPHGWRAVPVAGSHEALIAELRKTNPAFAESLAARLANLAATATYAAFDASGAAIAAGTLATLVVTEVDLPPDVSLQTFTANVQQQVQQLVEQPVQARRILIASGEAYDIEFVAPITRPDGTEGSAAVTQVLYVVPGRGYVMTFTAPPSAAADYARVFAGIATSFTISL